MERSVWDEMAQIARGPVAEFWSLLFPVDCAGCGVAGEEVCPRCRSALAPTGGVLQGWAGEGLPVRSGLAFTGVTARVLRAVKADARPRLARSLAPALGAALRDVAAYAGSGPGSLHVVPVPSTPRSLRARGFRVVEVVASAAGVRSRRSLELTRRTADQRGLDSAQRKANLHGSMSVTARADLRGRRVVIIDDVVTTGATLVEAARALTAAGAVVVGAATVAATPRLFGLPAQDAHRPDIGDSCVTDNAIARDLPRRPH